MTAENPLPILASLARPTPDCASVALQKLCSKGKPRGAASVFKLEIQPDGRPVADKATAAAIAKAIKRRRIHHHDQPEIRPLLDRLLTASGMIGVDNVEVCTWELLKDACGFDYEPDLIQLARREGIPIGLVSTLDTDAAARSEVYTTLFTRFLRHVREDVFDESAEEFTSWEDTLTEPERQLVTNVPHPDELPAGWTVAEAQSLWLMHQAGQDLELLASMVGQPETVLLGICDLFAGAPDQS